MYLIANKTKISIAAVFYAPWQFYNRILIDVLINTETSIVSAVSNKLVELRVNANTTELEINYEKYYTAPVLKD